MQIFNKCKSYVEDKFYFLADQVRSDCLSQIRSQKTDEECATVTKVAKKFNSCIDKAHHLKDQTIDFGKQVVSDEKVQYTALMSLPVLLLPLGIQGSKSLGITIPKDSFLNTVTGKIGRGLLSGISAFFYGYKVTKKFVDCKEKQSLMQSERNRIIDKKFLKTKAGKALQKGITDVVRKSLKDVDFRQLSQMFFQNK